MSDLVTDRLLIRRFAPADADALHQIYGDPEVMALAGGTCDRTTVDRVIARYERDFPLEYRAVVERASGRLVGEVGVIPLGDEIEIGWTLHRDAHGRGFATEAARAMLAAALGPLGLERVIATILPENAASIRVAEKIGMRADGWMDRDGAPHLRWVAP